MWELTHTLRAISLRSRILLTEAASLCLSEGHALLKGLLFLTTRRSRASAGPWLPARQPRRHQGAPQVSLVLTPHPAGQNNELILSPPSPFLVAMMT